ncbi:hypothetical protein V6N12_012894 [Hibiscus sabdariffa]|uniref:Uncharacterized protein n=1 Tax=Hibiscus sabdariffa TaxID=183260 RepID=A0ABR2EFS0_9ROSI
MGSAPTPPPPPPPAQSEEAAPIHILQLRSQLQRIEARQLQHGAAPAGNTEQLHLSEEDIFDWHTPMEHQSQLKQADIPGSFKADDAPAPAEPPAAQEHTPRRRGKTPAKRIVLSDRSSSPEQPEQQPAKRQRRYHAITTDSDDESSAGLPAANPEKFADPSLSNTF